MGPEPRPHSPDDMPHSELGSLRTSFLTKMLTTLPPPSHTRYIAFAQAKVVSSDCKEDYAGNNAPWSWWKVTQPDDEDQPIEAREIPTWEGERVREYFREADRDAAEKFDGK